MNASHQIDRWLGSLKISTTNLFNSVILLFNPGLMPLLFSIGQSADAHHNGGGHIKTKWKSGGLKRARRADSRKELAAVKEEGWWVYGMLPFQAWIYSASVMDCERAGGNKAMSMMSEDKLI